MDSKILAAIPDRFRVLREPADAFGPASWLVEDRLFRGRRCVLAMSGPEAGAAVWREESDRIRALLKLRHPGLAPVAAARTDEPTLPPFLAVEKPEGVPLLERVRRARAESGPAAAYSLLRRATAALCGALEYLHEHGLLHYDLRPGRVLLVTDDAPVIVGYGLGAPGLEDASPTAAALGYVAPEILRGDPVDLRADLYSLGVVLYEALAGRNPFLGNDATETTRAHLEWIPFPPRELDPKIPRDLDEIVTLLLAKNPSRTFSTAREVALALSARRLQRRRRAPSPSPYAFTQNEFVGRAREQRGLESAFQDAARGRAGGAPVVILGPAGVGKSRLLAEFRQRVRLQSGAFVEVRPSLGTGPIPQILRWLTEMETDGAPSRPESQRTDLSPEELGEEAAARLAAAAARTPFVVSIDDVHALEPESARALTVMLEALGRPGAPDGAKRVLVCLALREEHPHYEGLRPWVEGAPAGRARAVLRLREFTVRELRAFVASVFGEGAEAGAVARSLERTAGRNPYLLEETIRSWIARGLVRFEEGRYTVDTGRVREGAGDLRTLMFERLTRLPAGAGRLLRLVAFWGRSLTHPTMSQWFAEEGALEEALSELLRRGFLRRYVRRGEERFEIAHALLADAVIHLTPDVERGALHGAIAEALEREPGAPDAPMEIAAHRLRSGDVLGAARLALAEGPEGAARAAGPDWLPFLEELGSRLPNDSADHVRALRCIAEARFSKSDLAGAAAAYRGALDSARRLGAASEELEATLGWAAVQQRRGARRSALRLWRGAARLAEGLGDEAGAIRSRAAASRDLWDLGRREAARRLARSAATRFAARRGELAASPRAAEAASDANLVLARIEREEGALAAAELHRARAGQILQKLGSARSRARFHVEEAWAAAGRGDYPSARREIADALALARRALDPGLVAETQLSFARIVGARGDSASAEEATRAALAELRRARARAVDAWTVRAWLASERGEHRRAAQWLAAAEASDRRSPHRPSRCERAHVRFVDRFRAHDERGAAIAARAELALARELGSLASLALARVDAADALRKRRRPAAARRLYLRALRAARSRGPWLALAAFRAFLGLARLHLAAGRTGKAERFLGSASRRFRWLRRFPELADLRAAEGEMALARARFDGAERAFEAALRVDDRLDRPFERADDLQGFARAALGRGDHDAADARATLAERILREQPQRSAGASPRRSQVVRSVREVRARLRRHQRKEGPVRELRFLRGIAMLQRELSEGRAGASRFERITRFACEMLRAERAYLFQDRKGGALLLAASTGRGEVPEPDGPTLTAARAGGSREPQVRSLHRRRAWLAVPVLREGAPVGTLSLESSILARRFDEKDQEWLRAVAAVASLVIVPGRPAAEPVDAAALAPAFAEELETKIVGNSAAIRRVRRLAARAAGSQVPVLIVGETGTGKELVARAIHLAHAEPGPIVVVSCASLSSELTESDLFGHEKGAYSGAHERRAGLLEQADGGMLVLDGIDEMVPRAQKLCLRFLETGEFRRLGSSVARKVRLRVVATMTGEPESAVARGTLRSDLFYRLSGIRIAIPPLRERREDLLPLIDHFLSKEGAAGPRSAPTPGALRALLSADWPGNVRELRAEVARWHVHRLSVVRRSDLQLSEVSASPRGQDERGLADRREELERTAMLSALSRAGGKPALAARLLRMPRSTFYWKARNYGVALRRRA